MAAPPGFEPGNPRFKVSRPTIELRSYINVFIVRHVIPITTEIQLPTIIYAILRFSDTFLYGNIKFLTITLCSHSCEQHALTRHLLQGSFKVNPQYSSINMVHVLYRIKFAIDHIHFFLTCWANWCPVIDGICNICPSFFITIRTFKININF